MTETQEMNRGELEASRYFPPLAEAQEAEQVEVEQLEDSTEPHLPEETPEQKAVDEAEAKAGQGAAEDQPTETLKEKAIRLAKEIQQDTPVPRRYWELGEAVNNALAQNDNKGKSKIIKEIAEQSHLSEDSIRKAQRFHQKYMNRPIFECLFAAGPHVSWHLVSNNLSIEPEAFVEMCETTKTASELKNAVIAHKAKPADGTNGEGTDENNGEDSGPQEDQEGAAAPKLKKKDLEAKVTELEEKVKKAQRRVLAILHSAQEKGINAGTVRALEQLIEDLKL